MSGESMGLLMLGLIVVAIMLGFPTAFTLMGLGMLFGFIAYFQPVPNVLIYAAAGWTRMRLWVFLLLDAIGSGLWIALCIGLGYAIGQDAVDTAKAISRYGLYIGLGLIVLIFARQMYTASKQQR